MDGLNNQVEPKDTELPKEPKDVLKLVKNSVNKRNFTKFLLTVIAYSKNGNYKSYRTSLVSIFYKEETFFILRSMIRFVRPKHQEKYKKDIEEIIRKKKYVKRKIIKPKVVEPLTEEDSDFE